ncbi:MAG TPA: heavy metal-associated domain-containing protein [Phycisphaerales bacterium]|nr:heavy metal-associated domain-containing protein [Phycisphaerales bacterium]
MNKHILAMCALVSAGVYLTGCGGNETVTSNSPLAPSHTSLGTASDSHSDAGTESVVLMVHGMSCPLCSSNVDKQLLKVPGVQDVKVDLNTGSVSVKVSKSNRPTHQQLAAAIHESGFTLVGEQK